MLRFHWFPPSLSPPTTGKGQEWCPVALIHQQEPPRRHLGSPECWVQQRFCDRYRHSGPEGQAEDTWEWLGGISHTCVHTTLSLQPWLFTYVIKNTIFYNEVCIISRMDKNLGFGGGETKDWIFVLSLTHCISVVIYNTSLNLVSLTCKVKLTSLTQRFWRAWDENICVKCWVQPWHIASAV